MASNNLPPVPAPAAPGVAHPAPPAYGPGNWPTAGSLTYLSGSERSRYRSKMQFLDMIHAIHLSLPDYTAPNHFGGDQWTRIHAEYMARRAALVAGPGHEHLPNLRAGVESLRATYYNCNSEMENVIAVNDSRAGPPARSALPGAPVRRHGGRRPHGRQRQPTVVGDGNTGSLTDGDDWEEDPILSSDELEETDAAMFRGYDTSNNS